MAFKTTFFFEQSRNGWTETLYRQTGDQQQAMTSARQLAEVRRRALGPKSAMRFIRVSNTDTPRDAVFHTFTGDSGEGEAATRGYNEPPTVALNLRMFSTARTWRSYMLRGFEDSALNTEGLWRGAGTVHNNVVAYGQAVVADSWAIQRRVMGPNSGLLQQIGRSDGMLTWFTVAELLPDVQVGDQVRISGSTTVSGINGIWRITLIDAPTKTYYVKPHLKKTLGTPSANFAVVRKLTYEYTAIDRVQIIGVSSRNTGRFSYLPRGRRSVQRV